MNKIKKLKKRFFLIIGSTVFISMILVFGYNLKIFRTDQKQEKEKEEQILKIYMKTVENSMDDIGKMLLTQGMDKIFLQKIKRPRKEIDRYRAMAEKKNIFEEEIKKYKIIDGLFFFDWTRDAYIGVKKDNISAENHTNVKENVSSIVKRFETQENENQWFSMKIKDSYYFFHLICVKDIYFCAWIKPENMILDLLKSDDTDNILYFINDCKGNILNSEGEMTVEFLSNGTAKIDEKKYRVMKVSSEKGFTLMRLSLMNVNKVIMKQFIVPMVIICVLGGLALIFVMIITSETVLYPFQDILLEEELKKKKAELQFLQIQISPHFLNNCLSLIRNLMMVNREKEAEKAIVVLSQYTRGSFNPQTEVILEEELNHVNAYIQLQKLRYDNQLELYVDVDEQLRTMMVPTMILQTFVENAVKHQMITDDILKIYVQVKKDIYSEKMILQIWDSGTGFEKDVLEKLNEEKPIEDEEGMLHIGIYNVIQRMKILYGSEKSNIHFENGKTDSKGAIIKITIPLKRASMDMMGL